MNCLRDKDLTPDWNVNCPTLSQSRRDPAAPLGDPPFPGKSERAIAASPQMRSGNGKQPEISLGGRLSSASVRLRRGEL